MTDEQKPKPRALTPIEQANLRRLLQQADEHAAYIANSPTAAEERRLKAEQKKLAEQESKMASRLAELQSSLDRVTGQLENVLRANMLDPNYVLAKRKLKSLVTSFRDALPQLATTKMKPDGLAEGLRDLIAGYHPEFFAPEEPEPEDEQAALDEQRAATAKAIVNAGRKARNEPPLDDDTIIKFPTKDQ